MRTGIVGALALVCACSSSSPMKPAPPPPFMQNVTNDLDLLFVIDNTVGDAQTVFAQNFPSFVSALDAFPGGRPNLHIGIVTSTVDIGVTGFGPACPSPAPNDNGLLVNDPRVATGCGGPNGRFISDVGNTAGTRTTNYTGTLADTFSCIAQVGANGCDFEAELEAMKRALDGSRPENAGFLRDGAALAIVILTDEDDCSVVDPSLFTLPASDVGPGDFRCQPLYAYDCTPALAPAAGTYTGCTVKTGSYLGDPADYYNFVTSLVPAADVFVLVIAGDPTSTVQVKSSIALAPSCEATINGNAATAHAGIRLADFASRFGSHGLFRTICQSDYSPALTELGQLLQDAESTCISGAIDVKDTDPANPGVQPACTVAKAGTPLPACRMLDATTPDPASAQPCLWFASDAACATTPTHLELHLVGTTIPVAITCAT